VIPQFNEHGYLPPGIHVASMQEIKSVFTWSERRKILYENLERFIGWVSKYPAFSGIIIDGSFVRGDKDEPKDVDLILEIREDALQSLQKIVPIEVFDKVENDKKFMIDQWFLYKGIPDEQNLLPLFMGLRDEEWKTKGLSPDYMKGLLRVVL
jgi:predicted nucleotidyltransferase